MPKRSRGLPIAIYLSWMRDRFRRLNDGLRILIPSLAPMLVPLHAIRARADFTPTNLERRNQPAECGTSKSLPKLYVSSFRLPRTL